MMADDSKTTGSNSPYSTVDGSVTQDEMLSIGGGMPTLLQLPEEILIEVILNLNSRERIALANTCTRFKTLIFSTKRLLRRVDFSKEGYLTTLSDIRDYFDSKKKYMHISEVDLRNTCCIRTREIFNRVGRAQNLVAINLTGIRINDIDQIGSLLRPLQHVKKLSLSWPDVQDVSKEEVQNTLREGFSRLTCLFLHADWYSKDIGFAIELCQELEELRLLTCFFIGQHSNELTELKKLKTFACSDTPSCINSSNMEELRVILPALPFPDEWIVILHDFVSAIWYFERNPEISKEYTADIFDICTSSRGFGWLQRLSPIGLLRAASKISNKNIQSTDIHMRKVPNPFCREYILSVDDTKKLLKNPRHQITYLNIKSNLVAQSYDLYSVIAAFRSLKQLVLPNIVRQTVERQKQNPYLITIKRPRMANVIMNEVPNSESSFSQLTKSTPCMESFTLFGKPLDEGEEWDLPALRQISNWKNLTSLYLVEVPITNGKFLIDIGKSCTNLQILKLERLGFGGVCCYIRDLLQMLPHCSKLRDFGLTQRNIGQIAELLLVLKKCPMLRRVGIQSLGSGNKTDDLIPAVVNLIKSRDIVLFVYEVDGMTKIQRTKLKSLLTGLRRDLNRSTLKFDVRPMDCIDDDPDFRIAHMDFLTSHDIASNWQQLNFL